MLMSAALAQRSHQSLPTQTSSSSSAPRRRGSFGRETYPSPSRWSSSTPSTPGCSNSRFNPAEADLSQNIPSLRTSRSKRYSEESPLLPSPTYRRKDSGVYYTASWGSPYTNSDSEVQAETTRRRRCQSTQSSEFDVDHPIFRVGVDRLKPGLPSSLDGNDREGAVSAQANLGPASSLASIASRLPRNGSNRAFTSERIKRYLRQQVSSERGNWWSDDSTESQAGDLLGSGGAVVSADKVNDFWLDLDDSDAQETVACFPLAETKLQGRNCQASMALSVDDVAGEHQSKPSNGSMTPVAVDDPAGRLEQLNVLRSGLPSDHPISPTTVSDVTSPTIGVNGHTPIQGPPSLENPPSSTVSGQGSEAIDHGVQDTTPSRTEFKDPDRASIQRRISVGPGFRKRLLWRGKAYVIAPPFNDDRGNGVNRPRLITPAEWVKRLQDWEDQGYDTRGFGRWNWQDTISSEVAEGQSTPIYPSTERLPDEWDGKNCPVKVPDLKEWESYVNNLNEERLRALGVSASLQEDSSVNSLTDVPMDRKTPSPYPLLALSPLEKARSVSSNRSAPPANRLSPAITNHGSATSSLHGIPMTASASLPTFISGFPIPGQSSAHSERQLGMPLQPAQQLLTPQQGFSTTQPLYNGLGAHVNPSFANLGGLPSVATVFQPTSLEVAQANEDAIQMQQYQQLQAQQFLLRQLGQLPGGSPSPLIQDQRRRKTAARRVPQAQMPLHLSSIDPGPRVPVNEHSEDPQVQSNDNRYHLEASVRQQANGNEARVKSTSPFDSGGILPDFRDVVSGYADVQGEQHLAHVAGNGHPSSNHDIVLHNPQPRGRPHSLSKGIEDYQRAETEDTPLGGWTGQRPKRSASTGLPEPLNTRIPSDRVLDTVAARTAQTPSDSGAGYNRAYEAWSDLSHIKSPRSRTPQGSSTISVSTKLNVEAEEFKYDPSHPFLPNSFSSTGMDFRASMPPHTLVGQSRQHSQPSRSSTGATGHVSTKLNVEAAAFRPRAQLPATEFSFSSTVASYKPIASKIPFIDLDGIKTVSEMVRDSTSKSGSPYAVHDRIFDLQGITVPEKKSKAIPIVHPGESVSDKPGSQDDTGEEEDESGRITQSQARHKKPRRTSMAGDEAPQFAAPSQTPFDTDQLQISEANTLDPGNHPTATAEAAKQEPDSATEHTTARPINGSLIKQKRRQASISEEDGVQHSDPIYPSDPSITSDTVPAINGDVKDTSMDINENSLPDMAHSEHSGGIATPVVEKAHSHSSKSSISAAAESLESQLTSATRGEQDYSDPVDLSQDQLESALRQDGQSDVEGNVRVPAGSEKNESGQLRPSSGSHNSDDSVEPPTYTGPDPAISDSPSPQHQTRAISGNPRESGPTSPDRNTFATPHIGLRSGPTISHLKPAETLPVSDWDSFLSQAEEEKLLSRSKFFDRHIDGLLSRVLDQRLGPLEKSLQSIQGLVASTPNSGKSKRPPIIVEDIAESDADDEEDDSEPLRQQHVRSPRRPRSLDTIKAFILEALEAHTSFPISELSDIRQTLLEMKATSDRQPSRQLDNLSDLRSTLQDVLVENLPTFTEAMRGLGNTDSERPPLGVVESERTLEAADPRANKEPRGRIVAENAVHQLQNSNSQGQHDLVQAQKHIELLETAANRLQKTVSEISVTNAVLESYLREAQSAEERRSQTPRETGGGDNEVRKAVDALRIQLEESIKVRDGLRGKFGSLQGEVAVASRRIEAEQASWREKEKEYILAQEIMKNRVEAETRSRERLEREVEALGAEQRESAKIQVRCEQLETANTNLESMANGLRLENLELQKLIARYQSEVNESREAGRAEVKRATSLMESQVEAANSQVNIVRAELEMELAQTRMELEHYKLKYEGAQTTGLLPVDDAVAPMNEISTAASETAEASLQEQHRKFERHLEDLKFQHDLALNNALDDKQRTEAHLLDRLSLSNAKTEHLQDKISHLEEKLEIARAAASAAAQAAQQAQARPIAGGRSATSPSHESEMGPPTKISPQALRESILVLQDQLQERENRIETLEQELAGVDREGPTKLKEQEAEIGWLRELLGVRMGDLEEIIRALSGPEYDRDAIRDAAIRLKANVDMEQQERERAIAGRPKISSFTKISALATPKTVLPLAAAWGSWRRGKENDHGEAHETASVGINSPSKSRASQPSFLSGLLTPTSTHTRRSPLNDAPRTTSPNKVDEQGARSQPTSPWKQMPRTPSLPSTPRLLSRSSYDRDAKSKDVNTEPTSLEDRGGDESSGEQVEEETSIGRLFGPLLQS